MNIKLLNRLREKWGQSFKSEPLLARSPGRINMIGEHTDYNNGLVLPAAIDKAVYVAVCKRTDGLINLYSEEFNEEHCIGVDELSPSEKAWSNYILGVVDQFKRRGYPVEGFDMIVDGDVPIGAGLSSSAAVECATAFALKSLFALDITQAELAEIAQKAEHQYAGVRCGIMDQFASVFGKKDHLIQLDCRDLSFDYVPLQLEEYKIVLLNTNVKHSLAFTEYNTRREECAEGVRLIQQAGKEVQSLREVTKQMLDEFVKPKNELIYRRCKFVVEENERLLAACDALKRGDLKTLGQKMYGSHDGLSKEYEVSCPELDYLVDAVRNNSLVLGARMMGGGFGGCTINIIKEENIDSLVEMIGEQYEKNFDKELTPYIVQTACGSSIIE